MLRETRAALHAAIDARCDELGVNIDSAEANKTSSLERELVVVDAALECWRAEYGAVRAAVLSLSDSDLESRLASLSSRLDDVEAQLEALPTAVVEPPLVGLLADTPALLSSIACFGRVLAPLPVTAADLSLDGAPSSARPGSILRLRLSLGARYAVQSAEELEVSLGMLVGATHVEAFLLEPRVEVRLLEAILTHDAVQRCVHACTEVPSSFSPGASVRIGAAFADGHAVPGLPLLLPVHRGVTSPLMLQCARNSSAPCICPDGRVYCPFVSGHDVPVFDADGTPLPSIPVDSIGLSHYTVWAAFADSGAPSLVLAECCVGSHLVAVDPATHVVRWTSAGCYEYSVGITILPSLGVVIVGDQVALVAHRLSDGIRVGRFGVPDLHWFLTADIATETVYGSIKTDAGIAIHAWACAADETGVLITSKGPVAATKAIRDNRPLAVVPPAAGKSVAHLVVGVSESPELLVLSLPSLALVHTHMLEGTNVSALAADPWGEALAVYDGEAGSLHVLVWPLPGMPLLL